MADVFIFMCVCVCVCECVCVCVCVCVCACVREILIQCNFILYIYVCVCVRERERFLSNVIYLCQIHQHCVFVVSSVNMSTNAFESGRSRVRILLAPGFFRGRVIPVTQKLALQWLPCQAPSIIGSALGLVGPVSVYCDWVR